MYCTYLKIFQFSNAQYSKVFKLARRTGEIKISKNVSPLIWRKYTMCKYFFDGVVFFFVFFFLILLVLSNQSGQFSAHVRGTLTCITYSMYIFLRFHCLPNNWTNCSCANTLLSLSTSWATCSAFSLNNCNLNHAIRCAVFSEQTTEENYTKCFKR